MRPTPQDAPGRAEPAADGRQLDDNATSPRRPVVAALAALVPALAAVAAYPGFVTQDGPAHLYNAHVLARSFDPSSPFRSAFTVRWEPLPNWAGHLALTGLVWALPPRAADRVMTAATAAGFAAALGWLRGRVAGGRGGPAAGAAAALLALNVTWLFGFTSFLLGACVFPVALGVWWSGRGGGFSGRRAGVLAVLVVLGYFGHLVSLGLTALGLVVLEACTPGARRAGRAATTALGLAPLLPLGAAYVGLMRRGGGGLAPRWAHLADPLSPRSWFAQLAWADPVSLARKDVLPLVEGFASPWCGLLAPAAWLAAGLALAAVAALAAGCRRERLGWWVLAGLLIVGGAAVPDTVGPTHGGYLPQRVVLLGLVALVPVVRLDAGRRLGRLAAGAVVGALALQTAAVWDYAATSERTAGRLLRAGPAVGTGQRVATLLTGIRTRFRPNPLLHADCALGVGTGNILWGDYEARFYYFPVGFRDGPDRRPDPLDFEEIALTDPSPARTARWAALLDRHGRVIDVVLGWGTDPALDAVSARHGFAPVYSDGPVTVWRRDDGR